MYILCLAGDRNLLLVEILKEWKKKLSELDKFNNLFTVWQLRDKLFDRSEIIIKCFYNIILYLPDDWNPQIRSR